jgi:hypothetical protein
MKLTKLIPLGLLVAFAPVAMAQDRCGDILAHGIWATEKGSTSDSYQSSFVEWFCSQAFSDEGQVKDRGASLGIAIGDLPISLGGHDRTKNWKTYYAYACSEKGQFIRELKSKEYFNKFADPNIVKAWSGCMSGDGAAGLRVITTVTSSPGTFTVALKYKSVKTPPDEALVRTIEIFQTDRDGRRTPISCRPLRKDVKFHGDRADHIRIIGGSEASLTCKRDVCLSTLIQVDADVEKKPTGAIDLRPSPESNCTKQEIAGCVLPSKDGANCLRCSFEVKSNAAQAAWIERTCARMPVGKPVKAAFKGAVTVTNIPAIDPSNPNHDCWINEQFRGPSGKESEVRPHTKLKKCTTTVDRETDFENPRVKGQGSAGIKVAHCQFEAKADRSCTVEGTMEIFTIEGQPSRQ